MVKCVAPCFYIFHAFHACLVVGICGGDSAPCSVGCDSDAGNATAVHVCVAAVVVEPLLQFLSAFGGVCGGETDAAGSLVPHGAVPFVVALHPSVVGVVVCLCTEESAICASAIGGYVGNTYCLCHSVGCTCLVGEQPCEVRGVLILGQRSVKVTETAHFVCEHISDTLRRAARASILVEDGWKVFALSIVYIRGQFHSALFGACLATCCIFGRLWLACSFVLPIGKDAAVNLDYLAVGQGVVFNLCHRTECRHKA